MKRLGVWTLENDSTIRVAVELEFPFIPPPPDFSNSDGSRCLRIQRLDVWEVPCRSWYLTLISKNPATVHFRAVVEPLWRNLICLCSILLHQMFQNYLQLLRKCCHLRSVIQDQFQDCTDRVKSLWIIRTVSPPCWIKENNRISDSFNYIWTFL